MDGCSEACVSGESDPFRGKGHPIGRDRTVSTSTRCVVCGVLMLWSLFWFVLFCWFMRFSFTAVQLCYPHRFTWYQLTARNIREHYITSYCIPSYLIPSHLISSHHSPYSSPLLSSPPSEYEIDQAEAGSITPVWPALQGSLYESQFLSQLFMVPHPVSHSHSLSLSFNLSLNVFYALIRAYNACIRILGTDVFSWYDTLTLFLILIQPLLCSYSYLCCLDLKYLSSYTVWYAHPTWLIFWCMLKLMLLIFTVVLSIYLHRTILTLQDCYSDWSFIVDILSIYLHLITLPTLFSTLTILSLYRFMTERKNWWAQEITVRKLLRHWRENTQ